MITPEEKNEIILIIGKHYSVPIINYLSAVGVKPIKAEFFTKSIIQQIVNGIYENIEVEFLILQFVKITKKQKEKISKKRSSILK